MNNNKFLLQINSGYFLVFSILFILFAAYFPVISTDYIFHDDVYYFGGWDKESCRSFSQYQTYFYGIARPVGGLIKCFYGLSFDTIPQAKYVRFFNVLLLTVFATMFYRWLRYCKFKQFISYAIAVLTVLMASYQVTIVQITNAHHLSAALLALIAIKLSTDAIFTAENINRKKLLISFVVMAFSILTYPPAAMMYWTFMAIYFFTNVKKIDFSSVKKLFLQSLPVVFSMVVPILWGMKYGKDGRSTIDLNLVEKFKWLFQEIIPISASYWDAYAPACFLYISLAIILSALVVSVINNRNNLSREFLVQGLVKISFGFAFLVMTFSPMLILSKYILPHRIFIAMSSLALFYVIFSLSIVANFLSKSAEVKEVAAKVLMSLALLFAVGTANYNISKYYVRHSNLTYNFFKYEVSNIDWKNPETKVHVVLSRIPYQADKYRIDEFGIPTTYWKDDVLPLIMAISNELKLNLDYKVLYEKGIVTAGTADEITTDVFKGQKVGKDRIIIDTNRIILKPYEEMKNMTLI